MTGIFSPDGLLSPTLASSTQTLLRYAYGLLLLLTLVQAAIQRQRFFVSERWGGYAISSPDTDWIQNPLASRIVLAVWMIAAVMLALSPNPVLPATINFLFARYYFIHMRWKGVLRGMGAPGFMTYWLAVVVLLLEFTSRYTPESRPLAILVAQVDFAFIMLSAGVYKLASGYAHNEGMDYGLVNPQWGYFWRGYRQLRPDHPIFRTLNHLAWSTEIAAAVLMLIPATRFLGGLLILVSFVFIALQIRLGFLCEMVIICTLLFFHSSSLGARLIDSWLVATQAPASSRAGTLGFITSLGLWSYLVLLPIAHAGLAFNFYFKRRLPAVCQKLLERYTNAFGLIIWRVFSVDVVNFYALIYRQRPSMPQTRTLVSRYGWRGGFRFSHVGESIAITSLFTTLKYYPSNSVLFRDRLLRYARTVPHNPAEELVAFEYIAIVKTTDRFEFTPIAEYLVDVSRSAVDRQPLNEAGSVHAAHPGSPIHEGTRPGTYAPLRAS